MEKAIILENIRSCYNVGNIIRSADAFGFDVIISGYTPNPLENEKVKKTSLNSENYINLYSFWNTKASINFAKNKFDLLISCENNSKSTFLKDFDIINNSVCLVFGNEKNGILKETLGFSDRILEIEMKGKKHSLNVGQSACVFMWYFS